MHKQVLSRKIHNLEDTELDEVRSRPMIEQRTLSMRADIAGIER
jgi:hypothetical protein